MGAGISERQGFMVSIGDFLTVQTMSKAMRKMEVCVHGLSVIALVGFCLLILGGRAEADPPKFLATVTVMAYKRDCGCDGRDFHKSGTTKSSVHVVIESDVDHRYAMRFTRVPSRKSDSTRCYNALVFWPRGSDDYSYFAPEDVSFLELSYPDSIVIHPTPESRRCRDIPVHRSRLGLRDGTILEGGIGEMEITIFEDEYHVKRFRFERCAYPLQNETYSGTQGYWQGCDLENKGGALLTRIECRAMVGACRTGKKTAIYGSAGGAQVGWLEKGVEYQMVGRKTLPFGGNWIKVQVAGQVAIVGWLKEEEADAKAR